MAKQDLKIEYTNREVIEDKLLIDLTEKSKVGILCTEDDLKLLIVALDIASRNVVQHWVPKYQQYRDDLKTLREKAFGNG